MITIDALLAAALLALATASLRAPASGTGSALFIAFGLVLALAWTRLGAPDVALAEAAIGAGVTGALLLDAAAQLDSRSPTGDATARIAGGVDPGAPARPPLGATSVLVGLASLALGALLAHAVLGIDRVAGEATRETAASIAQAGIAHPVTAVLLVFRAYDTLLEVVVLLVAAVAAQAAPPAARAPLARDPLLARVAGITVPLAVLVAGYLLWAGATRTGGAFQAGAVLAGALLLARLSNLPLDPHHAWVRPPPLALGAAVFVALGLIAGAAAGAVLAWPQGWTGALVLVIEAALMVSIAAALVALFGWRER